MTPICMRADAGVEQLPHLPRREVGLLHVAAAAGVFLEFLVVTRAGRVDELHRHLGQRFGSHAGQIAQPMPGDRLVRDQFAAVELGVREAHDRLVHPVLHREQPRDARAVQADEPLHAG